MGLKSHRPRKQRQMDDIDEQPQQPVRRRRKLTLEQLEKRVARRRVSNGVGGVVGMLQRINQGMGRLNQEMAKQSKKMPSDREINRQIWG